MNINELYWVAGFLEGEGAFILRDRHKEQRGTCVTVKASQVNPEPLLRIKALLGGQMYGPYSHRPSMKIRHQQPFYEWSVYGSRAAQIFMTLYPLMSDVRKRQIHRGLVVWKTAPLRGAAQITCKRGHVFDEVNTYLWRGHRACRQCNCLRQQKAVALKHANVLVLKVKQG